MKAKIVHISTSSRGGAGVAAKRLHLALLKKNMDSVFVALDDPQIQIELNSTNGSENRKENYAKIILDKISWRLKHHFGIYINRKDAVYNRLAQVYPNLSCEIATLPYADFNILDLACVKQADIIHLHWIAGMVDYPSFFKMNKKPLVWSMHDMNPFQGLFHYKNDQLKNEKYCGNIDSQVEKIKVAAIKSRNSSLRAIGLSSWMTQGIRMSKAFKDVPINEIPNPIDFDVFSPRETALLRKELGIKQDNTILLFVSESLNNYRKGLDLLVGALNILSTTPITVLTVGKSKNSCLKTEQIIELGQITGEAELAQYYSLADAFIIPSREDNLPNVMLESFACGTPVISFNVGGMSEWIKDGFNGLKAKTISENDLALTISSFIDIKSSFDIAAIRQFAITHFSDELIAEKFIGVYNNVLINA